MFSKIDKNSVRKARHHRQRRNLNGTCERPRLNVYRSTNHIYAQIKSQLEGKDKKEAAKLVGKLVGERALEKGVKKVVFDRGGYLYTGRVAALAEGAREAGLDF